MVNTLEYYIDFCKKVFEYVCQRIIIINRNIILNINFYTDSNVYGEFRFPSELIIHLSSIIKNETNSEESKIDNNIKIQILHTIIHELFHANQKIDTSRYHSTGTYSYKIEAEVEYATSEFILSNLQEIQNIFNVDYSDHLFYMNKCVEHGMQYRIRTIQEYIFYILESLTTNKNVFQQIKSFKNVYLNINNYNTIIIKNNNRYTNDVYGLSNVLYNEAFRYNRFDIRIEHAIVNVDTIIIYIYIGNQMYGNPISFEK